MFQNKGIDNSNAMFSKLFGSEGPAKSRDLDEAERARPKAVKQPAESESDPKDALQAAIQEMVQRAIQEALSKIGGGGEEAPAGSADDEVGAL